MTANVWQVSGDRLAQYLAGRRRFGGKGRAIRRAEVADVIPVQWPTSPEEFAVARVRVTTDEGVSSYQLFLSRDDGAQVADALENETFRRGLVDAFSRGVVVEGEGGVRWIIESEGATPLVVPPHTRVLLSKAEQTNSSVIAEGEAILKLYRKLEPGVHPDVEVTRFLTIERAFVHVPVLLGTIRFEDASGTTVAGMLQELVPGAVDGWTFALRLAAKHIEGKGKGEGEGKGERAGEGEGIPFVAEARELGVVTRAMHETLASGDPGSAFEMRQARAEDVTAWCQGARRTISRAFETLEAALRDTRLPGEHAGEARGLLDRRAEFLQWPSAIAGRIGGDAGATTRTHGDYHLGQVLRSSNDRFLVIDFEGEPARSLDERRAHQSPLRDVAGMLRSFAYAASSSGTDDARSERWQRATRDAFLAGYFAEPNDTRDLLPRSQANVQQLLALFEAEKVFYELYYELDHRPDWVWIPLQGIASIRP